MGKQTEKENLLTQMAISMKGIGKMEKPTDMAYFGITQGGSMKDIGKMTNKVGLAHKLGLMAINTKDNINLAKRMAKDYINGSMAAITKEIG
jgi:hypothetical protein